MGNLRKHGFGSQRLRRRADGECLGYVEQSVWGLRVEGRRCRCLSPQRMFLCFLLSCLCSAELFCANDGTRHTFVKQSSPCRAPASMVLGVLPPQAAHRLSHKSRIGSRTTLCRVSWSCRDGPAGIVSKMIPQGSPCVAAHYIQAGPRSLTMLLRVYKPIVL